MFSLREFSCGYSRVLPLMGVLFRGINVQQGVELRHFAHYRAQLLRTGVVQKVPLQQGLARTSAPRCPMVFAVVLPKLVVHISSLAVSLLFNLLDWQAFDLCVGQLHHQGAPQQLHDHYFVFCCCCPVVLGRWCRP